MIFALVAITANKIVFSDFAVFPIIKPLAYPLENFFFFFSLISGDTYFLLHYIGFGVVRSKELPKCVYT